MRPLKELHGNFVVVSHGNFQVHDNKNDERAITSTALATLQRKGATVGMNQWTLPSIQWPKEPQLFKTNIPRKTLWVSSKWPNEPPLEQTKKTYNKIEKLRAQKDQWATTHSNKGHAKSLTVKVWATPMRDCDWQPGHASECWPEKAIELRRCENLVCGFLWCVSSMHMACLLISCRMIRYYQPVYFQCPACKTTKFKCLPSNLSQTSPWKKRQNPIKKGKFPW